MARPEGATIGGGRFASSALWISEGVGAGPSAAGIGGAENQIMLPRNRIIAAIIIIVIGSANLCIDQETCSTPASFPKCDEANPDRLLGLELQALARDLLPGRAGPEKMVRLLRRAFRYRGNQQQLLSPAQSGDVRGMARAGAARLLLCGEGKSLPDSGEEAQGLH